MIDPAHVPDVEPDELLARFILFSKHIRREDESIRPDAFVPYPHRELSVTRHRDATDDEVWSAGRAVAEVRGRTLYGRADVAAVAFLEQGLSVLPAPVLDHAELPDNPNHANVTEWPDEKPKQKRIALEVAARAKLVRPPER